MRLALTVKYVHWSCCTIFARVMYVSETDDTTPPWREIHALILLHCVCTCMLCVCEWDRQQETEVEENTCTDLVTLCLHVYVTWVRQPTRRSSGRKYLHWSCYSATLRLFARRVCYVCEWDRQHDTRRSNARQGGGGGWRRGRLVIGF